MVSSANKFSFVPGKHGMLLMYMIISSEGKLFRPYELFDTFLLTMISVFILINLPMVLSTEIGQWLDGFILLFPRFELLPPWLVSRIRENIRSEDMN